MTQETFKLIDAVQSESIEGQWGVVQNVNTRDYFGTNESIKLDGQYLYVYQKRDGYFCFISKFKPTYTLAVADDEDINIYKID
ncbi:MAG: hypothetical protein J6A00_08360 [Bacteroides sp.]|jgi:hypothetical protein|nr:hypothetical protein [Bacteroides sp.]